MFDDIFKKEVMKKIREGLIRVIGVDNDKKIIVGNNETKCIHEFIPMFNTICCKYCGVDKDKI